MMLNAYRTFFKRIAASFTRPPGMANSIIHSSGDSEEPFARKPDQVTSCIPIFPSHTLCSLTDSVYRLSVWPILVPVRF